MAHSSSSVRGDKEAVRVLGMRVEKASDSSLQYHLTSSANVGIPSWYIARKRSPSSSSWMERKICLHNVWWASAVLVETRVARRWHWRKALYNAYNGDPISMCLSKVEARRESRS